MCHRSAARRPRPQYGVRVHENARLRGASKDKTTRGPLDVAQLRVPRHVTADKIIPVQPIQMTVTCGLPSAFMVLR